MMCTIDLYLTMVCTLTSSDYPTHSISQAVQLELHSSKPNNVRTYIGSSLLLGPWFHSWNRGRVKTLDALLFWQFCQCGHMKWSHGFILGTEVGQRPQMLNITHIQVALVELLVCPHEVEPWFHSWYRGRVETLDAKYNSYLVSSLLTVSMVT